MKEYLISLKEINKKNILKLVIEKGPISRVSISRLIKISRPTITAYINELIQDGLVKEIGKADSTPYGGKRAVLLKFNSDAGYILGVMIGVNTIRICLSDLSSKIIKIVKVPTEEWLGPEAIINKIIKGSNDIIKSTSINKENIIGIGIGATGLVDSNAGVVIFSPNLTGWCNIRLEEIIGERLKIPAYIENECRVQAIAEKIYGLAKNSSNFVCVETGIGIGTGVFINNKLLVGNKGMAGEIGHIITNISGNKTCHCGDVGCLETLCSIRSLIENIREDIKGGRKSMVKVSGEMEISDLSKLYKQGDEVITRRVEENARYLGIGISNAIKMFNPEIVIIHGKVIEFGEEYLKIVKEAVCQNTFPKVRDGYNIQLSKLGEDVGLIGATSIVFENVFGLNNLNIADEYIIKKNVDV